MIPKNVLHFLICNKRKSIDEVGMGNPCFNKLDTISYIFLNLAKEL